LKVIETCQNTFEPAENHHRLNLNKTHQRAIGTS
jgi:hypothetical protein